jgi:hypothetical protein
LTLCHSPADNPASLYSFNPPTLAFTKIGPLTCEPGNVPFAMSVARDGTAWVLYNDGHIFNVSTLDASCKPTAFQPGQQGFTVFGMGFSADSPGGTAETLFGCWQMGLAKIDTATLTLTPVGTLPGLNISSGCDLTGTGSGNLHPAGVAMGHRAARQGYVCPLVEPQCPSFLQGCPLDTDVGCSACVLMGCNMSDIFCLMN